MMLNQS